MRQGVYRLYIPLALLISIFFMATCSFGVETLDQVNNPAWTGGAVNIAPTNKTSQTFVPSFPFLTGVDVALKTGNKGKGGDQVTLKILGTGGKQLASVPANINEGFEGFWHFNLPGTGISVTRGQPHTIMLQDTGKIVFWWKYKDGNTYPSGQAYFGSSAFHDNDFFFKTYGRNATTPGPLPAGGQASSNSNPAPSAKARQSGSFVEITNDIVFQRSSRACSSGAVKVDVCPPNCSGYVAGTHVAFFKKVSNNTNIGGPVPFFKDNPKVGNFGSVGFSLCNVGIVLDGNATKYQPQLMSFKLTDLDTGSQSNPYPFNWGTPAGNATYNPRIFRSPDGTIILFVTASNIGPSQLTAGFLDKARSFQVLGQIPISKISGSISAAITSDNKISFSFAGTAYPSIAIP